MVEIKEARMRQMRERELHELPYIEMVKSVIFRLSADLFQTSLVFFLPVTKLLYLFQAKCKKDEV